jgi:hypothetical protein
MRRGAAGSVIGATYDLLQPSARVRMALITLAFSDIPERDSVDLDAPP